MKEYILQENEDGTVITVKDVQEILLDIVVEFDRIINKYNLDYTLAYGSELGAIRHNGFIPWDDDIDIFMEREDYTKLIDALNEDLSEDYYFQCYETNDKYNTLTPAMKIKAKGTHIEEKTLITNRLQDNGIFIDIFIFSGISETPFKHYLAQTYSIILMPVIILLDLIKIDSRFFTKRLYNHGIRYEKKNANSKYGSLNVTWTFNGYTHTPVLKTDVFPSVKHQFEDKVFRVSRNSDAVLSQMYGKDYMTPPKVENQVPHHIIKISIDKKEK